MVSLLSNKTMEALAPYRIPYPLRQVIRESLVEGLLYRIRWLRNGMWAARLTKFAPSSSPLDVTPTSFPSRYAPPPESPLAIFPLPFFRIVHDGPPNAAQS